jgi:hypothetical protein
MISSHQLSKIERPKIIIFVTFPKFVAKKIKVDPSYSISIIFQVLPKGEKTIFCQGQIINQTKTFLDYQITDNDRLAVISSIQNEIKNEIFWKKQLNLIIKQKNN